jgi:hypothetical protein
MLLKSLLQPGFPALLRQGQRGYATIFVLHPFRDPEHGNPGNDTAHQRSAL